MGGPITIAIAGIIGITIAFGLWTEKIKTFIQWITELMKPLGFVTKLIEKFGKSSKDGAADLETGTESMENSFEKIKKGIDEKMSKGVDDVTKKMGELNFFNR